ncbi:MAG: polymer-forming cytoskeletal protein [Alphaproteobacteria bacterium]
MFARGEKNGARFGSGGQMPSIIAADVRIVGQFSSQGDVQIDGTVEGDVRAKTVTIGPTGAITGEVVADSISISGAVNGRLRAKNVSLARSARVKGDIAHESLSIEAGAQFEGQVERLDGVAMPAEGARINANATVSPPSTVAVVKVA